jgi:phage/conjugal plasmid C-4 type zinc finger TraR family protein
MDKQILQGENFEESEMGQIAAIQINEDAVNRLRAIQEARGPSLSHCEECGEEIPEARRMAIRGVKLCIYHQEYLEKYGSLDV